jgi:Lecithin retinol acyltransferase
MLLRRSIGLVWLGRKPRTAAAVSQITGLRQGTLAPGTHLVTLRRGYMHHGIYVGHGMVVHYAGLSRFLHSGPVEEVTMSRFSMGRLVRIIEYSESKYSPREIVRRARSRLGENDYQVLRNNCEHPCNWCISGRSHSRQVESPLASTLRALVIAAGCAKRLPLMLGNLPATARRVVESWVSSTKCAASSQYSAP